MLSCNDLIGRYDIFSNTHESIYISPHISAHREEKFEQSAFAEETFEARIHGVQLEYATKYC